MRRTLQTLGIYGLWMISTLVSFFLVFMLHEFATIVMESLGWSSYTINVIDKFLILVIGLATVIFFLYIQNAYLTKSWMLFLPVSGLQLLLYACVSFFRLVIIHQHVAVLQTIDYIFFGLLVGISILLFYGYRILKVKSTSTTVDKHR